MRPSILELLLFIRSTRSQIKMWVTFSDCDLTMLWKPRSREQDLDHRTQCLPRSNHSFHGASPQWYLAMIMVCTTHAHTLSIVWIALMNTIKTLREKRFACHHVLCNVHMTMPSSHGSTPHIVHLNQHLKMPKLRHWITRYIIEQ